MKISEFFAELATLTPDQIAEKFKLSGIKGKTGYDSCPLIKAIYHYCPDYWPGARILLSQFWKDPYAYYITLNDPQIIDPVLPDSARKFAYNFDNHHYPELEVT